jgi:serine/threonine-protein kinase
MELEWLGPYQIVGKLGRGGMGTVFEAVHRETGEPAALKLLSPALAQEEGFRSRFEAEIETLRKLNHPNIVRLFGFGEQDGQLYYAMELVDGNSLEEELRRGQRFEWQEVTRIGIEICRALRHAHDRGIIHRDIKPGNLLMVSNGRVKLSDFGIARLFGNTRLTSPGNVLGTAEYMAPEQAEGGAMDGRADLYSLGTLMYALLAGRPVFRGKSLPEMLHMQRFEQPEPLRKYAPEAPEELEQIVAQLLEKDPNRRVPNANVLGRRLEAILQTLGANPETAAADPSWFVRYEPFAAEQAGDGAPASDVLPSPESDRPDDGLPITQVLPATANAGRPPAAAAAMQASKPTSPTGGPPARGRFVPVAEEELDQPPAEEPRPTLFSLRTSWQTWVLAGALLVVGLTIRWFLQPLTADALYQRIDAKASDPSPDALPQAETDIRDFLNRFPSDRRAAQLRGYEKEIELYWLEKRFRHRVQGLASTKRLQPIEQAYLEALPYIDLDAARGMAKLQAIVDLYQGADDATGPTALCLELARRRLAELQAQVEKHAAGQLRLLRQRLDAADALRPRDPEQARAMYRAVVELYGDKPWAADAIRRARQSLAEKP